ncbi:MAG: hypothetical protein WEG36_07625 [Gemmatimonadota bacterium]
MALRIRETLIFVGGLVALAGCGDGGTGPSEVELSGTWAATEIEFASIANPSLKVEIVALGAAATLTLLENGNWTLILTEPGESPRSFGGTWTATSEVLDLTLTFGFIGEWQFEMALAGDTLTLSGAHMEFDVDGDEQDEAATLRMVLARE